jgi:hypothetical protein
MPQDAKPHHTAFEEFEIESCKEVKLRKADERET